MDIRTLPRTALDRSLRLVRKPLDVATELLPDGGDGHGVESPSLRSAAKLVVDRAEAVVRDVAGRVWRDPELRDDARRRRLAADERERALRLQAEAERRSLEADADLRRRQEEAEQRRLDAERQAEEQRRRAEADAQAEKRRAAEQATRQKAAARKTAARTEAAVDKQARRARLDQLDDEAAALAEQEKALTAADEAQRLRKEAARAKATRKQQA